MSTYDAERSRVVARMEVPRGYRSGGRRRRCRVFFTHPDLPGRQFARPDDAVRVLFAA